MPTKPFMNQAIPPPDRRLLLAIGMVSMAIIAFQICLMEILSIVQWHHFAYMIISVALLGFGASGTSITLMRTWLLRRFALVSPVLMILCGIAMVLSVRVAQSAGVRFDSFLLFAEPYHIGKLAFTCLSYFIPFFLGAFAIGLAFARYAQDIGRLYGANLFGSGLGGIFAICLMWLFLPEAIPAIIAFLPLLAAVLMIRSRSWALAACLPLLITGWFVYHPPILVMSEFKGLSKTLDLPEAKVIITRNSPYGVVQVVSSPALRYAPGVSLMYQEPLPLTWAVFNNGDWRGPLLKMNAQGKTNIMDYTTSAFPFWMGARFRVLILDAGTGADVIQALTHGVREVNAVEPNPLIAALLENAYPSAMRSRLHVHTTNSRTFLMQDTSRYDLIALPMLDAFGGSSGLSALSENYLLTSEALTQMWEKLTPQGVLSISCWLDYPPRNSLKLIATVSEVLARQGVNPKMHLAAVRGWGTLSVAVKRSPITLGESARVRGFCEKMSFDPALLPDIHPSERARFHALQDYQWFSYLDMIISPYRDTFLSEYDFHITPATDNRPYFSQFLRWRSLERLRTIYGQRAIPFFELSYLILILTMAQITVLSLILIVLPLRSIGWGGKHRLKIFIYFSGIGVGYMCIEVVMIQRLILYLGNPIYSASTVISALLIFSGLGSSVSTRFSKQHRLVLAGIVALILLYALLLTPFLSGTIALPLVGRLILALLVIAPLAFCMGMPFPLGIARLSAEDVPWSWGINSCLSVVSVPLASIIAVEMGFSWVMIFSALAYVLPFMVGLRDKPVFTRAS